MTRETLLDLIGQIDDDLIERAVRVQVRRLPYRKWVSLSIAASLCIVIASVGFLPMRGCGASSPADGAGSSSTQSHESSTDAGAAADSSADMEEGPTDARFALSALTCLEPDTGLDTERSLSINTGVSEMQITDRYTVRSHADTDQTVTFAYPFDGSLDNAPVLEVDGTTWSLASEAAAYTLDGIDELTHDDWIALQLSFASDDAIAISSGFQTIQTDETQTHTFITRAGDLMDAELPCVIADYGAVLSYRAFRCDAKGQPMQDQPPALRAVVQRPDTLSIFDRTHAWTLTFSKTIPAQGSVAVELRRQARAPLQQWQIETDTENLPSVSATLHVMLTDALQLDVPALRFTADASGQSARLEPGQTYTIALQR